jgi:tRNA(adenine34) deaminase
MEKLTEEARRSIDEHFMRLALAESRKGLDGGEVPVGALVVRNGEVIASAFNQPISSVDPSAHAEIVALRGAAGALGNYRLTGTTLYVTLEPCLMCVGALVNARISRLVFGASEPKTGAVRSLMTLEDLPLNHRFEVTTGVLADDCRGLIQDFVRFRRGEGAG